MNRKFLTIALGLALTATVMTASAQKKYTEGVATYAMKVNGQEVETKTYFRGDSSYALTQQGPATIKVLSNTKGDYLAILVDVPVASMKKAAVATPAEIEQAQSMEPKFTFTPGTETKVINGFNCKKVMAKDDKGKEYEAWVTNDVTAPSNGMTKYFASAGGFPVQFTTTQMGQSVNVTLKSMADAKVPAGAFSIPIDYERITLTDLKSLGGR